MDISCTSNCPGKPDDEQCGDFIDAEPHCLCKVLNPDLFKEKK